MTIDHTNPLKQRVSLYRCKFLDDGVVANDQAFVIGAGVIRNGETCGQYNVEDLSLNGETPLFFQVCAPSLFRRKGSIGMT